MEEDERLKESQCSWLMSSWIQGGDWGEATRERRGSGRHTGKKGHGKGCGEEREKGRDVIGIGMDLEKRSLGRHAGRKGHDKGCWDEAKKERN